jgi:uncharacterized protein YecT (DUF1311 family)
MRFLRTLILVVLPLCYLPVILAAQNKVLDSLERSYQLCLDKGEHKYQCALTYYTQLNSLLDTVYLQLCNNMDSNGVRHLRLDQQAWLEKKELFFKKMDERVVKLSKKTMDGLDDEMISTDNKAAYIKERLLELLSSKNFANIKQ